MPKDKPKPWARSDIPDLTGKVAMVTGGTRGIGFETAKGLVEAGAEVILLGRSAKSGEEAVEKLKKVAKNPSDAKVSFFSVDLSSFASIREFAQIFNQRGIALDILVNNAGVLSPSEKTMTEDGYETTMATNHLAPFMLTGLLLPSLKKSSYPARVVTVSSALARMGKLDIDDFNFEKPSYDTIKVYGTSKQANLLFAIELKNKSETNGWGILSFAVHPGLVKTDATLTPGNPNFFSKLMGLTLLPWVGQEPHEGANSSIFAATSTTAISGEYYGPNRMMMCRGPPEKLTYPDNVKNPEMAKKLWEISEKMTNVVYN